jgi:predicted Zn-dependent protease
MCEHHSAHNLTRRGLVAGLTGVAGIGAASALAGCATNPETGRSQLLLVSDAQLTEMSVAAWSETKAKTPISKDPRLGARLVSVGTKIQQAAGRGGEAWEFVVFDTDEKNAFVLPGGRVGCYRGLMQFCDNDSQLAAVLGHETGHVTAHHAAERASQSTLASGILGAAGGGDLGAVGVQYLLLMPNGRLQESEADRLGVDYMYRAGFDVTQAVRLWEKMGQAGGSRNPEFLSTHPSPATRIADIQNYINLKGYAKI